MHLKQLQDLSKKTAHTTTTIQNSGRLGGFFDKDKSDDNPITQLTHDAKKLKEELKNGGLNDTIKEILFNRPKCCCAVDHEM
jgi:Cop9 signalosome subunit 5 C-terminal domain